MLAIPPSQQEQILESMETLMENILYAVDNNVFGYFFFFVTGNDSAEFCLLSCNA